MATLAVSLVCRHGRLMAGKRVKFTCLQQKLCHFCLFSTINNKMNWAAIGRSMQLPTWESFGIWLDDPVVLPPKISALQFKEKIANIGCISQIGKRKQNEDRFSIAELSDGLFCFAVFDGHRGSDAAEVCSCYIGHYIQRNLQMETVLENVLLNSFLQIDNDFIQNVYSLKEGASGTTATVVLLNETLLTVASVGDSPAILCREGKAKQLTEDHTPRRRDEKKRIKDCGGFIDWNSAGDPYVNGRLAMTRSIGDVDLKPFGVTAQPEVNTVELEHTKDCFLILTTDGVSGILEAQEVCDIVKKCQDPSEAAAAVNEQALQYGTQDNLTTMVIPFGAWGKYSTSLAHPSFGRMMVTSSRWS
ncbi:protein phosphatase 1K, mitochondrial-like [Carcharodon carcharias]|uniref:protein phosphatase 1K, mitochondrial-like n=1 Tax=Carcharodon carcharias TaxID=13397 RepID=UPI001B7DBAF2|nr:protein phosphatase 1K, mitochondrial-like [Carcharodon carcharias]XP_041065624.1 protein phosphatase 1K, mitochondrial-like [Carcharodon carcharias]XP_041065625.1 protein phosphatase 1K, mitochondrial-like [Carcharodon carcharias]XP_041065626.1 protein phosphatase 1K, mitochondrial-like [Carcharodon carcharias]